MAVCRECHDWIGRNPKEATRRGYIVRIYRKEIIDYSSREDYGTTVLYDYMKIDNKIGDEPIKPGSIIVTADPVGSLAIVQAIEAAAKMTITGPADVAAVTEAAKKLKAHFNEVEKSRTTAKAPFLAAERKVDEIANPYKLKIDAAYKRLTSMLADFAARQIAIQKEEARKKAAAEAAELERQRKENEEAERQRQELIAKQQASITQQDLENATFERELFEQDVEAQRLGDALALFEFPATPEPKQAIVPGMRTQTRYKYVLNDPVAAYKFNRTLVRFELDFQTAELIRKGLEERGLAIEIPGVTVTPYTTVDAVKP